MGVNITHIIKHDFRQTHDIQLCLKFAKKTIERLKKELLIQSPYESFELQYDEALNEIRFELPIYRYRIFRTLLKAVLNGNGLLITH